MNIIHKEYEINKKIYNSIIYKLQIKKIEEPILYDFLSLTIKKIPINLCDSVLETNIKKNKFYLCSELINCVNDFKRLYLLLDGIITKIKSFKKKGRLKYIFKTKIFNIKDFVNFIEEEETNIINAFAGKKNLAMMFYSGNEEFFCKYTNENEILKRIEQIVEYYGLEYLGWIGVRKMSINDYEILSYHEKYNYLLNICDTINSRYNNYLELCQKYKKNLEKLKIFISNDYKNANYKYMLFLKNELLNNN